MRRSRPEDVDPLSEPEAGEIEAMLRRLPLARPSPRLDERVRLALTPRGPAGWFTVGALSSAAAAGILLVFGLPFLHRPHAATPFGPTGPGNPVVPVVASKAAPPQRLRVERDAGSVQDDGIVARVNGVPIREYRCRTLRQVWYFDAEHRTHLSVTVPVDEVVVVPVRTF